MSSKWSKRLARRGRGGRWQDQLPPGSPAPRAGETFEQYKARPVAQEPVSDAPEGSEDPNGGVSA